MSGNNEADGAVKQRKTARKPPRQTPVDKLTLEDLLTLRLSEADTAQFEHQRAQIKLSREELHALESQEASENEEAHDDRVSAAQKRVSADMTAMVHFLAPRVMKLRDGEAKRKWRSFVTKLQKDSKSV